MHRLFHGATSLMSGFIEIRLTGQTQVYRYILKYIVVAEACLPREQNIPDMCIIAYRIRPRTGNHLLMQTGLGFEWVYLGGFSLLPPQIAIVDNTVS